MYSSDYKTEVTFLQDGKDKGYKVEIPALKATIFVDDKKDIPRLVKETIETAKEVYKKRGIPIPKPDTEESDG